MNAASRPSAGALRPAVAQRAAADLAVAAARRVAAVAAVRPAVDVQQPGLAGHGGLVEVVRQLGVDVAEVTLDGGGAGVVPGPVTGQCRLGEPGRVGVVLVVRREQAREAVRGRLRGVLRVRVEGADDRRAVLVQDRDEGVDQLLATVGDPGGQRAARGRQGGQPGGLAEPEAAQALRPGQADRAGLDQGREDQLDLRRRPQGVPLDLKAGQVAEQLHVPGAVLVAGGHHGVGGGQPVDPGPGVGGPVGRDARAFGLQHVAAVGLAVGQADRDAGRAGGHRLREVRIHEVQVVVRVRDHMDEGEAGAAARDPRRDHRSVRAPWPWRVRP